MGIGENADRAADELTASLLLELQELRDNLLQNTLKQ